MDAERPTYQDLNRRTVTEIQSNVVEKGKRHAISRAFHAKTDKDAITAWQQDLNRILHIFNVCSIGPGHLEITECFPFRPSC